MRSPSAKKLYEVFGPGLTMNQAHLIRALAKATEEDGGERLSRLVEKFVPETERYVRSLYTWPWDSHITLIYRKTDTLSIGDWGTIAERHPNW
jgi:hypothetical protein